MKAFWLGRLARPDIIKPINDLATKLWTKAADKKALRLIQYIDSTKHYRLVGQTLAEAKVYLQRDTDYALTALTTKDILQSVKAWYLG